MIELPRSTFYYSAKAREQTISDADLVDKIRAIKDEFPPYGRRRVTAALRRQGVWVNKKRIGRLMRTHGLTVVPKRRFVRTTDSAHDCPVFPNRYGNVIPKTPDAVWVADITYIRLGAGFAYLAVILDACSRKVVGYAISKRINTKLVLAALNAAVESRKPTHGTCIHHSDRGVQYASDAYRQALADYGLIGSMSSRANPYHNAQAESFMKTLKVEEIYIGGYETFDDVVERLPPFIEDVYNTKRLHSALGYQPPEEFETQLAQRAA